MSAILQQFLSQATARSSKSSALHSLIWAFGLLLSGVPIAAWATGNPWIWGPILVGAGIVLIAILVAYFYFMVKNPDALRTENYSLSKLAMERGLMGDSLNGLFDGNTLPLAGRQQRAITQEDANG